MCAVRESAYVLTCMAGRVVGRVAPALGPLTGALRRAQSEDGGEKIVMDNCYWIRLSVWDEKVLLPQSMHVYTCNQATTDTHITTVNTVAMLTYCRKAHLPPRAPSSITPLHYAHSRSLAGRVILHLCHLHPLLHQRLSQPHRSGLVSVPSIL
jgi:hypothetical protein